MREDQNPNDSLRRKFIVSEADFGQEQLEGLVERVKDYCVVDETGGVHLRQKKLPKGKQVGLCLVARFIASKLDSKFTATLSADQISSFVGIGKAEVVSRAKELIDHGFAIRAGRGQYRINPARIEDFLITLIDKRS